MIRLTDAYVFKPLLTKHDCLAFLNTSILKLDFELLNIYLPKYFPLTHFQLQRPVSQIWVSTVRYHQLPVHVVYN